MSESLESKPRRSFTQEFKREAVRLATERDNVSAVARDLGIGESCLNRWKRQLLQEAQRPCPGNRRELARLKQENEILKKAVGIFTKRPTSDTDSCSSTRGSFPSRRSAG